MALIPCDFIVPMNTHYPLGNQHQILVANAICPKLIRRGRHIILIEIPEFDVRFLSSHNYLIKNRKESLFSN
jgi:hypothetical protein